MDGKRIVFAYYCRLFQLYSRVESEFERKEIIDRTIPYVPLYNYSKDSSTLE
jgi:hypothetical protein